MKTVYLSLGSNLGDRRGNLERGLEELGKRGMAVAKRSSIYETEPVEVSEDQPDFLNLACEIGTDLDVEEVFHACKGVERLTGRRRKGDKTPREIDVDILFYGQEVIDSPHLKIPHPGLYRRNFVLIPLEEIAPEFKDPATGKTIQELRRECADQGRVSVYARW